MVLQRFRYHSRTRRLCSLGQVRRESIIYGKILMSTCINSYVEGACGEIVAMKVNTDRILSILWFLHRILGAN